MGRSILIRAVILALCVFAGFHETGEFADWGVDPVEAAAEGTVPGPALDPMLTFIGITAVRPVIQHPGPDADSLGLTGSRLRADVEEKLRRAGIQIVDEAVPPSRATLRVGLDLSRSDGSVSYVISLQFCQTVTLWSKEEHPAANTWDVGSVGIVEESIAGEEIRSRLRTKLNRFVREFHSANPRT